MTSEIFEKLFHDVLNTSHQKDYLTFHKKRFKTLYLIIAKLKPQKILDIGESGFSDILRKGKYNLTVLNKVECDLEKDKIPLPNDAFDLVIYTDVIEHLRTNHFESLKEIYRVLKPGGLLIFSTPNKNSLRKFFSRNINKGHFKEFSMQEGVDMLNKLNFNIIYKKFALYLDFTKKDIPHFIYYIIVKTIFPFRESILFLARK